MKYSTKNDYENLIESNENTLIVFSADWCSPCNAMAHLLDKANEHAPDRILKLNIDSEEIKHVTKELGVQSIPTILTFNKGSILNRKSGMIKNVQEILQLLN